MCGIIGVIGSPEASKEAFLGLITLQHRGQDAAGILSYDHSFHLVKNLGLVENVFTKEAIESLTGTMAIGHARYSTVGKGDVQDVQPFVLNYPYGIGIAHNGNVVNYLNVKERLHRDMRRRCFTHSDSETILNWFAHHLEGNSFADIEKAVRAVFQAMHGSYSVVGLLGEGGIFAFRDPHGIKPLVLGKKKLESGARAYMVASETVPLSFSGYEFERDLKPGELVYIQAPIDGVGELKVHSVVVASGRPAGHDVQPRPCMFEWVYFAAAESQLEGAPVYRARLELGRNLAKQIREKIDRGEIEADLVAPVPDTARTAAASLAEELGLPFREVLIKNRYIKRTFILGSQHKRKSAVDLKLNPVASEIKGKNIILVDDSIVRGTTSRKIVELVRRAGAKKICFVSTCPPIRFPCFYGIDFPDRAELIAADKNEKEVASLMGADSVVYQDVRGLIQSLAEASGGAIRMPCMACLDGQYPTDVSESSSFTELRAAERKPSAEKGAP